jgi:group I intron endonuclease
MYVGSAVDLSIRLSKYYSPYELKRVDNYISRALIYHNHSVFSLSIVEYIDISTLDKKEARVLILEREQYYIDSLLPEYNILKVAGSSLGYTHSVESLAKLSEINKGKSLSAETKAKISIAQSGKSLFAETKAKLSEINKGKSLSAETKAKLSEIKKGKAHSAETLLKMNEALSGYNHPMFGKSVSAETKAKLSEALSGKNHPMFGKSVSAETKAKISAAQGTTIYVYSSDGFTLINTFPSANNAAKHFYVDKDTVLRYARNTGSGSKIFKEQWFFSTSLITP